ncbi:unnamed protein product [Agarophyton chilense]
MWVALRGAVFDVTRYARFHPGGHAILLAAAGTDVTELFNRYHPWVNADFMLAHCYLGALVDEENDGDGDGDAQAESAQ